MKKIFFILFSLISVTAFCQRQIYGKWEIDSIHAKLQSTAGDTTNFKPVVQNTTTGKFKMMPWLGGGGSGVTTMAAIGSSANANGASISGSTLTLQPASTSFGGLVTTGTQGFEGVKLFNKGIQIQGAIASPTGVGLELEYASSVGYITSFNRTGSTWQPLEIRGSTVTLKSSNTAIAEVNSSGIDMKGFAVYNQTSVVNAQTGTTYTVQASDRGKIITLNNASGITVTVPTGLGAGFACRLIQKGAGQVTFSASRTTINNRQSHTKIAGQHGRVTLEADVSNNFYLAGDTAP